MKYSERDPSCIPRLQDDWLQWRLAVLHDFSSGRLGGSSLQPLCLSSSHAPGTRFGRSEAWPGDSNPGSKVEHGPRVMNKTPLRSNIGRPKLFATSLWTRTSTIHVSWKHKTMNHHSFTRTRIWSKYKKKKYLSDLFLLTSLFWGSEWVLINNSFPHTVAVWSIESSHAFFPGIQGKDDSVNGSTKPPQENKSTTDPE